MGNLVSRCKLGSFNLGFNNTRRTAELFRDYYDFQVKIKISVRLNTALISCILNKDGCLFCENVAHGFDFKRKRLTA